MDNIITFLTSLDIFASLTKKDVKSLYKYCNNKKYESNNLLFNEGDNGDIFYIIYKGSISSYSILKNGSKRNVAQFGPGDFFGEMAIFEDTVRSATCITQEDSHLITLSKYDFFNIVKNQPQIAITVMNNMLQIITHRLKNRSYFLSDLVKWGEKARRRAIIDDITGIYNRRFLDDSLENLAEKSTDQNIPLTMVMIDIDNFKNIVQNYSMEVVNSIIIEIVAIFQKYISKFDIFARYGGDEFSILMPGKNSSDAFQLLVTICKEISSHTFLPLAKDNKNCISVSMGIASLPDHAISVNDLQQCADEALYKAKRSGKNQVMIY